MENKLGLLRCLNALGEFEALKDHALQLMEYAKTSEEDLSAHSWMNEVTFNYHAY
jgi:hypothetical protein